MLSLDHLWFPVLILISVELGQLFQIFLVYQSIFDSNKLKIELPVKTHLDVY